ncbi:hypothetical protein PN36_18720 [Candidatus Thiomargarita nelsonii]|uniref:Autotransporter domain-containing protein n=1 Tax=Candidatus Thiomargarita nelsonii TaxID=1003181 RepID=A0A0A6PDG7_9GAMM|nr:hypothetical protein PN36_18720 [Candidatus Thiomargarita nelsonii]
MYIRNLSRTFTFLLLLLWIAAVQSATVNLSVDKTSVIEGESFTLTVSLDETQTGFESALVRFTIIEGGGGDLNPSIPSAVTLDSDNRQQSVSIETVKDNVAEDPETFTFKIGIFNPTGDVTLGQNTQIVTVTDPAVGQLQFSSSNFTVNENAGSAIITVERVGGSDGTATVNYATSNGSAIAGSDYQGTEGVLNWANGESGSKTISIPISDNTAVDGDRTVNLRLTNSSILTGLDSATLTIIDDDLPEEQGQIQFSNVHPNVTESDGTATITVERVGGSDGIVVVNYATSNGSANAENDYQSVTGSLTWGDGETGPKTISIPIINDSEKESDETILVELTDSAGNVLGRSTLTILGDPDGGKKIPPEAQKLRDTGNNPTQQEMGVVVGTLCQSGQASPGLQKRCNELLIYAEEFPDKVANALQQMASEEFATQGRIASQTTAAQFKNVNARLNVLRTGVRALSFSGLRLNMNINGQRLPTELLGSFLTLNNATDAKTKNVGSGFSRLGAFVNGEINFGDKDTTDHESGFEFSTLGLTTGIDYRFTNKFIAGMALGYSNSESDLNANGGNIDSDGYSATLYGTFYQSNAFYIDGLYTYGRNSYDSERNIVYQLVTPINQTAFSSNDSAQHALGLGMGYHFNRQAFTFTPNARLDYVNTDIDGFSEEFNDPTADGASLGLAIDSQEVESLTLTLGVQADYAISQSWGILIPYANLDYVHEFKNDVRQLTGRFLQDRSGETFSLSSDAPDKDYFNLGFGLSTQFSQGKAAFIRYEGTLGLRDVERHAIMLGVRLEF